MFKGEGLTPVDGKDEYFPGYCPTQASTQTSDNSYMCSIDYPLWCTILHTSIRKTPQSNHITELLNLVKPNAENSKHSLLFMHYIMNVASFSAQCQGTNPAVYASNGPTHSQGRRNNFRILCPHFYEGLGYFGEHHNILSIRQMCHSYA